MAVRLITNFGLTLALLTLGCSGARSAGSPEAQAPAALAGQIRVVANEDGFVPNEVVVARGKPAMLSFLRTTNNTCAKKVVFPELNIEQSLPLNAPVTIDIPAGEARTYVFQCGMGMYKSALVVR